MRKILCLIMTQLNNAVLDECAQHSFLVEPLDEQEVLLDLSIFNKISSIVDRISYILAAEGGEARIGLATSPLFARLAVRRTIEPQRNNQGYRYLSCHGISVTQIPAGQEGEFLESLPIAEILPLSGREQKLLIRRGYSTAGELKALNPSQLRQMLKRDSMLLWQNCQGIDYTPVQGIYPEDHIVYAHLFPGGCADYLQIKGACRAISQILAQELEKRHVVCHQVRLETISELESHFEERIVTQACQDAIRLGNIMQRLLPTEITVPIEEIRVVLQDLERLQMQEMNLFTLRQEIQLEQRQVKRQNLLNQLQEQYPGSLQLGLNMDRRDQILALWDPWRIVLPTRTQV